MTQHTDIKTARIAADKTVNTAPTAANFKQQSLLNQLEIKVAELKLLVSQINAAGGLLDSASATALSTLLSQL